MHELSCCNSCKKNYSIITTIVYNAFLTTILTTINEDYNGVARTESFRVELHRVALACDGHKPKQLQVQFLGNKVIGKDGAYVDPEGQQTTNRRLEGRAQVSIELGFIREHRVVLLTTYYSLLTTTYYVLRTTNYLLLTTHYSLFTPTCR